MIDSVYLFFDVLVYGSSLLLSIFGWQRFLLSIDKHYTLKKSKRNIWIFFAAGFLSPLILIFIVYPIFEPFAGFLGLNQPNNTPKLNQFAKGILLTGPTEELTKFLVFFLISKILKTFHEPKDAMIQCATVALGFAVNENIYYANDYGAYNMALRSIFCISAHMVFSGIIGYFYGLLSFYRLSHNGIHPERLALLGILPAGFLHGFSIYMIFFNEYLSYIFDALSIVLAYRLYIHLQHLSPYRRYRAREAEKGIGEIHHSLSLHPKNSFLLKRMGLYHLPLRKYSEALGYLDKSIQINPKDKIARIYKAIAHIGNGEKEKGESQLLTHRDTIEKHHITLKKDIKEYITDPALKIDLMAKFTPEVKVSNEKSDGPAPIRKLKKKPND